MKDREIKRLAERAIELGYQSGDETLPLEVNRAIERAAGRDRSEKDEQLDSKVLAEYVELRRRVEAYLRTDQNWWHDEE